MSMWKAHAMTNFVLQTPELKAWAPPSLADTTWVLAFVWPRGATWDGHHDSPALCTPWGGHRHRSHIGQCRSSKQEFMVGTVVEARFAGRSHWYPGVIHRVHADSSLDIQYDDGDFEMRVKATLVRKIFEEEMSGLQRQCTYLEQFIVRYRTTMNARFVVYTNEHTPQTLVMTLACQLDCMTVLCFGMICVPP